MAPDAENELTDDGSLPLLGRDASLPAPRAGPVAVVTAVGVAVFAVALWNLGRELATLSLVVPPLLAFLTGAAFAAGVWYGAYRLHHGDFDGAGRWLVAGFCLLGALVASGVTLLTTAIRMVEGRPVAEPTFVFFTAAGSGAVAGLLVGWLYTRVRRDAARARRARDRFAFLNSTLRHDVLNNMMIVRSRAEHIRDAAADDRTADFAGTIVDRSDEVVQFVERVRALLSRLSDDRDREPFPVSLTEAVRNRAEALDDAYPDVDVETDVPDGVTVVGDDLLEDVVGNLLRNAVDHNDADRLLVAVTVTTEGDRARLRVADNGPGIPDDLKDAVFRRGQTGLHEDGTGSGFGLFFVDAMVTQYGGSVHVEDNEPTGAVFVVDLPLATD
ncbi:MAG: ATP-binding protein [Haloferacaceae archaeon]